MEQRATIISVGVKDLQASTDFYISKFGWKPMDSSNAFITFFRLNGMLLSLYPREKLAEDATVDSLGSGFNGFSLAYNTRTKEEVDSLFKTFKEEGVRIVKAPEDTFWGGYSGHIADLDDTLWEIAFNPFLPLDNEGNVIP
jgi:predicted lactoylglutathione lyase